jgi:hypothetical protein
LHGTASNTYSLLGKMDPKMFARTLGAGEIAVGALVLAPVVPPVVAGAALMGFSGALLNMWWNTPGMHEEGSPRPTPQGAGIAKDVWMFGIGVGLVADGLLEPAHDKKIEIGAAASARGRSAKRQAKKLKKRNKSTAKQAKAVAKQTRAELSKRGQKAASKAQKQAAEAQAKARAKAAKSATKVKGKAKSSGASDSAAAAAAGAGAAFAVRAQQAREAAKNYVDEYGPVAVDKAKIAAASAQEAALKAKAAAGR